MCIVYVCAGDRNHMSRNQAAHTQVAFLLFTGTCKGNSCSLFPNTSLCVCKKPTFLGRGPFLRKGTVTVMRNFKTSDGGRFLLTYVQSPTAMKRTLSWKSQHLASRGNTLILLGSRICCQISHQGCSWCSYVHFNVRNRVGMSLPVSMYIGQRSISNISLHFVWS